MALIKKVRGHTPAIGENTFLAETAVILGDVTIGRDCSIWYNAVLRGDVNKIVIGDRTNIQDGVVLHTLYDGSPHPSQTIIGSDVSVGHNAQLEPNSVYAGVPAKKVKEVTPQQREEIIRRTARDYMLYASWFKEEE